MWSKPRLYGAVCAVSLCVAVFWNVLLLPMASSATPMVPPEADLQVSSAILLDVDRNRILFEQNADMPIPPASLTKVMSMFLALDLMRVGVLRPQTVCEVSRAAAQTSGSRMGLLEGEHVTVEELLTGMAVASGNDASVALAELVGGTQAAFVAMMNFKARRLGMRNTNFANPHGLPAPGQYTTARDMLTLARAYVRTHPQALRYHNTHVLRHNSRLTWNKNPLLGQYPGADGLKTGWVRASGYNLIFTALRGSKRLLAVILGAPDAAMRSIEAFRLLDAGFQVAAGMAAAVPEALLLLPQANYHPDISLTAREARSLYPGGFGRHVQRHGKGKHRKSARQMARTSDRKGRSGRAFRQKRDHSGRQAARRNHRRES